MTAVATDQERIERLAQLDATAAHEWAAYGEVLRGLDGLDYEVAEGTAWEQLQEALAPIQAERDAIAGGPRRPDAPTQDAF